MTIVAGNHVYGAKAPVIQVVSNFMEEYDYAVGSSNFVGFSGRAWPDFEVGTPVLYRASQRVPQRIEKSTSDEAFEFLGPPKPMQFQIAEALGMPTVEHGRAGELWAAHVAKGSRPDIAVVVYENEQAHGGNGKRLRLLRDVAEDQPDVYCSIYYNGDHGRCVRVVQLGNRTWRWMVKGEPGAWSVSRADSIGEPTLLNGPWHPNARLTSVAPVWGYDLVYAGGTIYQRGGGWVVCDVNFAPGIRGLGLHEITSYSDVGQDIKDWFLQHQRSPNWCANYTEEFEALKLRLGK